MKIIAKKEGVMVVCLFLLIAIVVFNIGIVMGQNQEPIFYHNLSQIFNDTGSLDENGDWKIDFSNYSIDCDNVLNECDISLESDQSINSYKLDGYTAGQLLPGGSFCGIKVYKLGEVYIPPLEFPDDYDLVLSKKCKDKSNIEVECPDGYYSYKLPGVLPGESESEVRIYTCVRISPL